MSRDAARGFADKPEVDQMQTRGAQVGPIAFYFQYLLFALVLLNGAYIFPIFALLYLDRFAMFLDWAKSIRDGVVSLLPVIETLSMFLNAWLMSSLVVCGLLYLWLKFRRLIAVIVTAVLAILWIVVIFQYLHAADVPELMERYFMVFGIPHQVAAQLIVFVLAVGVLVLPALWFVRPYQGFLEQLLTVLSFVLWLILTFGLQQYIAGIVLLFSLVLSGGVLLIGLYITSGFLLPLSDRRALRGKIFNFLRDLILGVNYPAWVVVNELFEEDKAEQRLPGSRFPGGDMRSRMPTGPGFVISDCDHAVAISSGIKFRGIEDPGVVFTGYAEDVTQIFDLRTQHRAFYVEALTTDGIKIKVLAFTPFRIDARGRQPSLGASLPFNKGAAFRAFHTQRMEHEGPEEMKQQQWDDLPRVFGERILQNIISKYDFDALYGPESPGGEPLRVHIAQQFCQELKDKLEPLGIQLVGGGISDLEPADPSVYLERVKSWQARWDRKVTLEKARGQAEWLRIVERARTEAQAELIMSLGRQMEELTAAREGFRPEEAVDMLVSVLEELTRGLASQHPGMAQLLPEETLEALGRIREALPY